LICDVQLSRCSPLSVIRIRCAVYISSSLDFSQADNLNAAAHDISAAVDGHEKSKRFDPAVLSVNTLVYFLAGTLAVSGTVTEPRT
jgi:hypothetical protein